MLENLLGFTNGRARSVTAKVGWKPKPPYPIKYPVKPPQDWPDGKTWPPVHEEWSEEDLREYGNADWVDYVLDGGTH